MTWLSPKQLTVGSLALILAVSMLAALPITVGYLDFGVYQIFAFLLLRFVSAWRVSLFGIVILSGIAVLTTPPAGVFVEAGTFFLLLFALDIFAGNARAEHRLMTGFLALLLVCLPLLSAGQTLISDGDILVSTTMASVFVMNTSIALVIAESVWMACCFSFNGFFHRIARHNESDRISAQSFGTVTICAWMTIIFVLLVNFRAVAVQTELTTSTRLLVDSYAETQLLLKNRQQAALAMRDAEVRLSGLKSPWISVSERYVLVGLDVDEGSAVLSDDALVSSERDVSSERRDSAEDILAALYQQFDKFKYRASMGREFAELSSPLFLRVHNEQLPVYTALLGEQILFTIDTMQMLDDEVIDIDTSDLEIRKIAVADLTTFGLPPGASQIIDVDWMGGVVWNADAFNTNANTRLGQLNPESRLTVPISAGLREKLSLELHPSDTVVIDLKVWPLLQGFFTGVISFTVLMSLVMLLTSLLSSWIFNRMVAPIIEVVEDAEQLKRRKERGFAADTNASRDALQFKTFSAEYSRLQEAFSWLSQEVITADGQTQSAVGGYEALLGALPLGVMEIDGDYQLRFRNDAMLLLTGDSASASSQLRQRAEEIFESGETIEEYTLQLPDHSHRYLLLAITPRQGLDGDVSGFWLLVTDLTQQREMDAHLLQSSKLATLGEMSTGMAHELNQPLNVIKLALSNIANSLAKGRMKEESLKNRLDRMNSAVDRAATIIDHMRAFGRVAGDDYQPFNISSSVSAACDLVIEPMASKGIAVQNRIDEATWVMGNTIQFEQVLINMMNNARDAITERSTTGAITLTQTVSDGFVTIAIEDTGGGIPHEALPHIFEPFFTTKPVGKGTGLGGSISYGIIQDMQGDIWAENTKDGAKISIRLPVHEDSVKTSSEEAR